MKKYGEVGQALNQRSTHRLRLDRRWRQRGNQAAGPEGDNGQRDQGPVVQGCVLHVGYSSDV